jgi:hypothetical protein
MRRIKDGIQHSVPKIVALITKRANTGARAYMGHNSWHMRYYFYLNNTWVVPQVQPSVQIRGAQRRWIRQGTLRILWPIGKTSGKASSTREKKKHDFLKNRAIFLENTVFFRKTHRFWKNTDYSHFLLCSTMCFHQKNVFFFFFLNTHLKKHVFLKTCVFSGKVCVFLKKRVFFWKNAFLSKKTNLKNPP